ncbi:hypothetical protein AGABI1DRAFT_113193 [Agaricus bisporus var. burnettii JB137-S8]|nr:uncharacterized protein AGABI1DRAFT_113193 [Agaricus bisporus var. burnettii JB137-S8]EKM79948.1 hypothetical protein AGABI1DRAFT_113193 [Agaricus bisporus var. burnettii JB137-S8]
MQNQYAGEQAASLRGSIEGGVAGTAVGLGATYYLNRVSPTFRRLPISLKAAAIVVMVLPAISIQAERRALEFSRSQWEGESIRLIDEKALKERIRWDALPLKEKVNEWAARYQYSIILGSWAAGLGLATLIISRNKYQTNSQKIVQARMWAQGLTIGLLIAAGALTGTKRREIANAGDHSWADVIEQQDRDRKEVERLRIHAAQTAEAHPEHA